MDKSKYRQRLIDPRCAACAREGPSQGGNHAAQGDIRILRLREPQLAQEVLQGADRQDYDRMARRHLVVVRSRGAPNYEFCD